MLNAERTACAYASGESLQLEGPISRPAVGITLYPVVEHRLLKPDGSLCFVAKVLNLGRHLYSSERSAVVLESKTVTTYRVICPDGTSYADDVAGTCADFGLRWLQRKAPGYTFECDGTSSSCSLNFWGHPQQTTLGVFTE